PYCPKTRQEVYIAGTQPVGICPLHGSGEQNVTIVSGWSTTPAPGAANTPTGDSSRAAPAPNGQPSVVAQGQSVPPGAQPDNPSQQQQEPPKKKGFFRRLFGVFR
ncbi:MAG: penicillin-binding protein 1A, partial [Acidobacteriia bacterium]|nr:penicillin-binding protein 1A [Terriglobia bacterium]